MYSEGDRLKAVQDLRLLDTPPERRFDVLVELVKLTCSVPIALLTLVDADRQWFKAKVGVDVRQTPLETSVCAMAMRQGFLFEVEDLADDPRTAHMSLVTGAPFIRFYAGIPLVSEDGRPLGSLCAIDTKPRPGGLAPDEREALMLLGEEANLLLAQPTA